MRIYRKLYYVRDTGSDISARPDFLPEPEGNAEGTLMKAAWEYRATFGGKCRFFSVRRERLYFEFKKPFR